ncbi:AAA family ATPase [Sulfuricurvum sp.]|uniref:ATP-dependent nuclease n=1 Tax=Sulfuricurvum sp. TaxID=2025608 RepID=UPI002623014A|nr:AAA family ATPase [Sulfuricurvum sp.]MDD3595997.1 AAA family ATPase [Sulfuricurvum sp.]
MKIENVKISNFRSIINIDISFENLMMFIGQNNHGKSNILYAILFFFGEIKIHDLDFFDGTDELFVEILFSNLDDTDQVTFKKYLTHDKKILVRKTAYKNGSFQYNGFIQNPQDECLQEANISNYTNHDTAKNLPFYDLLPHSGRLTKALIQEAQASYIENHQEEIVFTYELEENNFLGLKSVAQGIFGEVFFIPAIKNVSDDLSNNKTSTFTKLYSKVIEYVTTSDADISTIKEQINRQFQKFQKYDEAGSVNDSRPLELTEFENKLASHLEEWGVNLEVEVLAPNIDDVFKSNVNIWIHDGIKTDIQRKGHGLQRAITFSLIKTLAEHLQTANTSDESGRQISKSSYFIFEEPELYLHPQAQRSLLSTLKELSTESQVILCTHSSSLLNLEDYKSIAIVRKDISTNQTSITQYQSELFIGNEKQKFNLLSWINPDRAELFFAKKVILVEGATEKTIIPFIAKKLGIFKFEYTLIDCASKDNIPLYIELLNKFKIPYIAVYDKDHQQSKNQDARNSADIISSKIENKIDFNIGKSIVFINDIEEELGYTAGLNGKPFTALETISQDTYLIPELLKNKIIEIFE